MKCGKPIIICNDNTCSQFQKHWTCCMHPLHMKDEVTDPETNKTGYIINANPWGSKRSVQVQWDVPEGVVQGKLFWGDKACTLQKSGNRR